jgi:N-acetylneuraminic acid mutarotase
MGKSAALLLVLIFLTASNVVIAEPVSSDEPKENSWTTKAPLQTPRSCLGVIAVNGKIYAIGGSNETGFLASLPGADVAWFLSERFLDTTEEYDPVTDTWTYKTAMPTPRIAFAIAVYKNKIYCIGGKANNGLTGVNEVYDPATDTWETKTPMPTPRGWLKANVVNGSIYLVGGYSPISTQLNEVYNPETDSWSTKTPAPNSLMFGFNSAASAVFDNQIYFIPGEPEGDYIQIYDVETDKWSLGASSPSGISTGVAVATTGVLAPEKIYVFDYSNVRVFDPENESWKLGADMLTKSRFNFGAAILNDIIYVVGGYTYSWLPGNYAPVAVNEQYISFGYGTIPQSTLEPQPEPEPFPVASVAAASVATFAVVGVGLLVYFRRRNHRAERLSRNLD